MSSEKSPLLSDTISSTSSLQDLGGSSSSDPPMWKIKLKKPGTIITITVIIAVIILSIVLYLYLTNKVNMKVDELKNSKEIIPSEDNVSKGEIKEKFMFEDDDNTLRYYGAHYCPFSNQNSVAYRTITEFKERYPDINVEIYMKEEHQYEFNNVKPRYVPYIVSNNREVKLSIPKEEIVDLPEEEAKDKILENIYNQVLI